MSIVTKDGYDSGYIINGLLDLVRVAYEVKVMKHESEDLWICSGSFRVKGEWFTLACRGTSYQGSFLALLQSIVKWKQDDKMPEDVIMGQGKHHPIETLADMMEKP